MPRSWHSNLGDNFNRCKSVNESPMIDFMIKRKEFPLEIVCSIDEWESEKFKSWSPLMDYIETEWVREKIKEFNEPTHEIL